MKRKTLLERLDHLIWKYSYSQMYQWDKEALEYCKKLVEKHRRATKIITKLLKIIDDGKTCDNCVYCDLEHDEQPCLDCCTYGDDCRKWRVKL